VTKDLGREVADALTSSFDFLVDTPGISPQSILSGKTQL
jgi:hypothetical protein